MLKISDRTNINVKIKTSLTELSKIIFENDKASKLAAI